MCVIQLVILSSFHDIQSAISIATFHDSFQFLCGFALTKKNTGFWLDFNVLCSRVLLGSVCHEIQFFGVRFTTGATKTNPTNNHFILFQEAKKGTTCARLIPLENFCSYRLFLSRMLCQEWGGNNLNSLLAKITYAF